MNLFQYTLKVQETDKAKTKKKKKELFNAACDAIPYWSGSSNVNHADLLNYKLATYIYRLYSDDVYMMGRVRKLNRVAGRIVTFYYNGKIPLDKFEDVFMYSNKCPLGLGSSLHSTLLDEEIPFQIKYELGKMLGALNE